jgi:ADP-ribosyl-[dinitrogen reductase] hydrolase
MLDEPALDRALGAVWASAVGDALGAPYEFQPSLPDTEPVLLKAGGVWELGEWTDDTSMAVPVLQELAAGNGLDDPAALGRIVAAWQDWSLGAKDVGIQTRAVLALVRTPTEAVARASAYRVHLENGNRSAGNGSLMRTGPVALGYLGLGLEETLAKVAARVSELSHFERDATHACVIWSLAIRHAVLTGRLDVRGQLHVLGHEEAERWGELLDEAEGKQPRDFPNNGWVVHALQAAYSAIRHGDGLLDTLERAVRCGHDTDTVAAIAGSLAGAVYGASALPAEYVAALHGWPGLNAGGLQDLVLATVNGDHVRGQGG